jgi:hypothetical protein
MRVLVAVLTCFVSIVVAIGDSSCIPVPHWDEQVTWKITECSFCLKTTRENDTLWMNYNGTLVNGTLFDSSYTVAKPWPAGDPFNFTLGAGQVIKG